MIKITTLYCHATPEGDRISLSYSEVSDSGALISQNVRRDFIVTGADLQEALDALKECLVKKMEGEADGKDN